MTSSNVQALRDFIADQPVGTKLNIATSQYADNTTADDFRFDFHSTAPAVRSLIEAGILNGENRWRYYFVTVVRNDSPNRLLDAINFDEENNWYSNGTRIAWYDRKIRMWTSYLVDDDGNQRTSAQYYANRDQFEQCEDAGHFESDAADLAEAIELGEWG